MYIYIHNATYDIYERRYTALYMACIGAFFEVVRNDWSLLMISIVLVVLDAVQILVIYVEDFSTPLLKVIRTLKTCCNLFVGLVSL